MLAARFDVILVRKPKQRNRCFQQLSQGQLSDPVLLEQRRLLPSRVLQWESRRNLKELLIDHPLDPANKYLEHSCVESDDRRNLYDGTVTLDSTGEARSPCQNGLNRSTMSFVINSQLLGPRTGPVHSRRDQE